MMSKAVATDTAAFGKDVLSSDLPVLVDFWADWCGPCKMLAPTIDKIAEELAGKLRVFKVDVEANPDLANQFRIQGIPTLILFSKGEPQAEVVGYRGKDDLMREIERAVGVKP
jgi:thioredoxin 1